MNIFFSALHVTFSVSLIQTRSLLEKQVSIIGSRKLVKCTEFQFQL